MSLFNYPYGIGVIDENRIVVSDSNNHTLRVISILGLEEPSKSRIESKEVKTPKVLKPPEEPGKSMVTSAALEILQNSAKTAAKDIRPSIIDMLLSYTNNPAKQTVCEILSLIHILIYNEKKKFETIDDIQTALKKSNLREKMFNLNVETVSHQNFNYISKQISYLKKDDDCKVLLHI